MRRGAAQNTGRQKVNSVKFMQVFDIEIWKELEKRALRRHVTVQDLLRAVIVPEYLGLDKLETIPAKKKRVKK